MIRRVAASQKMRAANISALPVCDGQQLVGILTERDLIGRATAKARNPQTATVREVMTTDLLSCFEMREAARLRRRGGHLPPLAAAARQ